MFSAYRKGMDENWMAWWSELLINLFFSFFLLLSKFFFLDYLFIFQIYVEEDPFSIYFIEVEASLVKILEHT